MMETVLKWIGVAVLILILVVYLVIVGFVMTMYMALPEWEMDDNGPA